MYALFEMSRYATGNNNALIDRYHSFQFCAGVPKDSAREPAKQRHSSMSRSGDSSASRYVGRFRQISRQRKIYIYG